MDISNEAEEEEEQENGDKFSTELYPILNTNKENSSHQIDQKSKSLVLPEIMDDGDKGIEAILSRTKTEAEEEEVDVNVPEIFPVQKTPSGNFKILNHRVEFSNDRITIIVENARTLGNGYINASKVKHLKAMKSEEETVEKSYSETDDVLHRCSSSQELKMCQTSRNQPSLISNIEFCFNFNECLHYRLRRAIHPDTKVVIGKQEFPIHSIALQAYSTYFDSIKRPAETIHKIHIPEEVIKADTFPILMDWILLENEQLKQRVIRKNNVVTLYSASMHLGISGLAEHCLRFIHDKSEKIGETVILQLFDQCRKLSNCKELQKLLASKFSNLFPVLYQTKHFLNMNVDEFVLLIASDDVKIQSELDIYDAASRWLLHQWENRNQYAVRVMACVRFGLLTPLQLTQIRQFGYNRIYSFQEIKDALQDGLTFAILRENYKNNPDEFRKWLELSKIHEPRPRTCIFSERNNSLESSHPVSSPNTKFLRHLSNRKVQNSKTRNSTLSNPFTMQSVLKLKNDRVPETVHKYNMKYN